MSEKQLYTAEKAADLSAWKLITTAKFTRGQCLLRKGMGRYYFIDREYHKNHDTHFRNTYMLEELIWMPLRTDVSISQSSPIPAQMGKLTKAQLLQMLWDCEREESKTQEIERRVGELRKRLEVEL